jgi:hypothetical protein
MAGFHDCRRLEGRQMVKLGMKAKRLWRPLIGVVVAYAVAAQSLLIALGGFALPAQANAAVPGFEICLHGGQTTPDQTPAAPAFPGCSHCVFCFAGSHHALVGSPPALFHRVDVEIIGAPWAADKHCLPGLAAYSIASPRGPPLVA